jgi:thioredoxin 1
MQEPFPVDASTVEAFIAPDAGPALVEFKTTWCAPCMALAPVMRELVAALSGTVRIGRINADDSPALASRFDVVSFPTLILFNKGEPVAHVMGFHPKPALLRWIRQALRATDSPST